MTDTDLHKTITAIREDILSLAGLVEADLTQPQLHQLTFDAQILSGAIGTEPHLPTKGEATTTTKLVRAALTDVENAMLKLSNADQTIQREASRFRKSDALSSLTKARSDLDYLVRMCEQFGQPGTHHGVSDRLLGRARLALLVFLRWVPSGRGAQELGVSLPLDWHDRLNVTKREGRPASDAYRFTAAIAASTEWATESTMYAPTLHAATHLRDSEALGNFPME